MAGGDAMAHVDWLDAEAPLKGFSWRGGSERDTNGILIWDRPFVVKDKNGEEVSRTSVSRFFPPEKSRTPIPDFIFHLKQLLAFGLRL